MRGSSVTTATSPSFPTLPKSFEVEEGRRFTFHLREGHRWSDGAPFTAEDFRYYWEDVAADAKMSKFGPPEQLLVDGEKPVVEFPDATTVRYTWSKPNPYFLPALAAAQPLEIFRPAHYLKQFHARYTDEAKLEEMVKAEDERNWVSLHYSKDRSYRNDNRDLPVAAALGAEDGAALRPLHLRAERLLSTGSTRRAGSFPISTRWC